MTSTRRATDETKRKLALECLRLEADCMQLACDAHGYNVQKHFVRMARHWSVLAVADLEMNPARNFPHAEMQSS